MKLNKLAVLSIFASLVTTGHALAAPYPETNVRATPDQVITWFQKAMSKNGAVQRSSSPGMAVFETPPTMVKGWQSFSSYMISSQIPGGYTGMSIEKMTVNATPGDIDGTTHVLFVVEHVVNYGSPYARIQYYKPGCVTYNALVQVLNKMKVDVEGYEASDSPNHSTVQYKRADHPSYGKYAVAVPTVDLVKYAAGMKEE